MEVQSCVIQFAQHPPSVHFYNHNLANTRDSSSFASATHIPSITNKETCVVAPVSKLTKANEKREQLEKDSSHALYTHIDGFFWTNLSGECSQCSLRWRNDLVFWTFGRAFSHPGVVQQLAVDPIARRTMRDVVSNRRLIVGVISVT